MATNRRTIGRPPRRRITSEAIAIFRRMLELEESCTCQPSDDEKYFEHECCAACDQWWQNNSALVDELRLLPWEWPAYENPNLCGDDDKPAADAVARYQALAAASEAAKKKR